ncbi:glycosyltransferase family 4 protein [Flavitalea sp.]|nr:glycosyltransferase family 4 protein [Flavitalea sp.]
MRVLLVGPRFHTNQYQMVKTLQEQNHDVSFHVASLGSTEDYSLLTPSRYNQSKLSKVIEKIFGKGGVNRPNYFPELLHYWKTLRSLKPDIVIIRDPFKYFSFIAAFYSSVLKARIIFYTQENLFRPRSTKTRIAQRLMIAFFKAAWMVPIKSDKKLQSSQIRHMYHIPLPIPIKIFSRDHKNCEEIRILMIGKYNQERKNHLLLINAVNILKDKYKLKLTMVGECSRDQQVFRFEKIKESVSRLGLANIIDMKRNVPYNMIGDLYKTHHVFVLPAVDEQYGISVTEALGYGLPVICTDTCGARFNIKDGENGLIIKSNSLTALTNALESLISNKDKLEQMSKNSEKYVLANLSGNIFYRRFSDLIQQRFNVDCCN